MEDFNSNNYEDQQKFIKIAENYVSARIDQKLQEANPSRYDPTDVETHADEQFRIFTNKEVRELEFISKHPQFDLLSSIASKNQYHDQMMALESQKEVTGEELAKLVEENKEVLEAISSFDKHPDLTISEVESLFKANYLNAHITHSEKYQETLDNNIREAEEYALDKGIIERTEGKSYTIKTTYGKELITMQNLSGNTEQELQKEAFKKALDRGVNLNNADFRKIDLSGETFVSISLFGADLSRANLEGTRFIESNLMSANFSYSDCTDASFKDSTINSTEFSYTKATNTNFSGCMIDGADFKNSNLEKANLSQVIMRSSTLSGCNLDNTDFTKANIGKTSFRAARMVNCSMVEAKIVDVDFSVVDAENISFEKAKLQNANMFDTKTDNINLTKTEGIQTIKQNVLFGSGVEKKRTFGRKK